MEAAPTRCATGTILVNLMNEDSAMIRVDVFDVESHLARYLEAVERGKTVVVCRRNVPIVEIRPVARPRMELRPVGIDRGMEVPPSFFEPLPEDLLDAFDGSGDSG